MLLKLNCNKKIIHVNYTIKNHSIPIQPGIFIPETRRYYLTSHAGLWKICRYSLVPTVLANSTAARNFTTLSLTNLTQVNALKQRESTAQYVRDAAELEFEQPITEIDNNFRRAIFAHWVRNNQERFVQLKSAFKNSEALELAHQQQQQLNATTGGKTQPSAGHNQMLDPTDVVAIRATIGGALSTIHVNNSYINVIVPEGLRKALFVDWEEQPNVLLLLFGFARDMEIPIYMINSNGTRYIIQPPPPPKRGKVGNGYEYKKFGRCIVGGRLNFSYFLNSNGIMAK